MRGEAPPGRGQNSHRHWTTGYAWEAASEGRAQVSRPSVATGRDDRDEGGTNACRLACALDRAENGSFVAQRLHPPNQRLNIAQDTSASRRGRLAVRCTGKGRSGRGVIRGIPKCVPGRRRLAEYEDSLARRHSAIAQITGRKKTASSRMRSFIQTPVVGRQLPSDLPACRLQIERNLVGAAGFELATPCTPCKCATRLRHAPTQSRIVSGAAVV
jgi:hypothetical protein